MAGNIRALFHDPSVGMASSVFPKFHPRFKPANTADAVTRVKCPGQEDTGAEAELDEVFDVEEDYDMLLVLVDSVVATEIALLLILELAVPGTH